MKFRHRLDVLTIYDPDRSSSTVNVWVSRPTPSEEQALGTLFCLTAIDGSDRMYHEMIGLLQEELRSAYYSQLDHQPEVALEYCLQRTNARLHQLILEGLGQWVEKSHILIGVLAKQQLLLTAVGAVHAYVVRRDRLHDILGQSRATTINPIRVFDHVISGNVENGDRLLFCTPSLLDYFSLEKLRRIILDHDPSQAVRSMETSLLGVDQRTAFGSIVIELQPDEIAPLAATVSPQHVRQSAAPQASMNQLVNREQATQKLLSPSIWPAVRDVGQQIGAGADRLVRTVLRQPRRRTVASQSVLSMRPAARSDLDIDIRRWLATLQFRFRRHEKKTDQVANAAASRYVTSRRSPWWSFTNVLHIVVSWLQRLGGRQRLAVGLILILLLTWSTAVVRTGLFRGTKDSSAGLQTAETIEEVLAQSDAALLFWGDDIARQHLTEAKSLLAKLPQRSRAEKEQYTALAEKVRQLEQRVSRITVVAEPTQILDVTSVHSRTQPTQLYLAGSNLVTADPRTGIVVRVNREDGDDNDSWQNPLDTGRIKTGTVTSGDRLLFSTDRGLFVELNAATGTWKPIDAEFPRTSPNIQSLSYFQNRVYALDIGNNAIVRFALSTNSLGTGANWLRAEATLRSARAAIVDGSIYVLQPGGQVESFFSGRPGEFSLAAITPPLTDATRLFGTADTQNLYLLDPAGHRIVVYTKEGAFLQQYQSPSWTRLRDIVADEAAKTLYILNGTTLQSISLATS